MQKERTEHDNTEHARAEDARLQRARLRATTRNVTAMLPHKPDKQFVAAFLENNRMKNRRRLYRALISKGRARLMIASLKNDSA